MVTAIRNRCCIRELWMKTGFFLKRWLISYAMYKDRDEFIFKLRLKLYIEEGKCKYVALHIYNAPQHIHRERQCPQDEK